MKNGIVICEFNSFRETIKRKKKGGKELKFVVFQKMETLCSNLFNSGRFASIREYYDVQKYI